MATIPKKVLRGASRLIEIEELIVSLSEEKKVLQDKIVTFMKQENIKEIVTDETAASSSRVILTERVNINYDIDKLKEKLDPDIFKQIIQKVYTINDFKQLVKLIVKYDVPKDMFLKLVSSISAVDRAKLNKLYDIGEVTAKDLKGCYTVSVSNSLKIKNEAARK